MNATTFRPDRVMVSNDGHAVSERRAERDYRVLWDLAFIRNDGWSLACPYHLEAQARKLWEGSWTMIVNRNTGTVTYLDRERPTVVG